MHVLKADKKLLNLLHTTEFQELKDCLNLLLNKPVWWHCVGSGDPICILESHNQSECGLLNDDPSVRDEWYEASYAAIWQIGRERIALMAACPPERIQVVVPILCEDEVLGYLGIAYLPVYEQRRLYPLLPLLTQHLRQIAERVRAEEDLQSIQRLWHEVVSTLDFEVLLGRVVSEIITALDASEGAAILVDRERHLSKTSFVGFDSGDRIFPEFQISATPYENKIFSWSQSAQMLSEGDPLRQWYLSLFETVSPENGVWAVPLCIGGRLLGMVLCLGKEGSALTPHVDTALETLTLGSSVALRNAIEFEQMRQKAVALGIVHSVYRLVSSTRLSGGAIDKQEILNRIGKLVLQVLNTRKCSIMLVDENGLLQPMVRVGLAEGEIGTKPLAFNEGIPGKVAHESTTFLVENPLADARFAKDPPECYPSRSYLSVPMFETEVIGVITVAERAGKPFRFSEGDREVLHTMAEQAVIALLNIDSYGKQEKSVSRSIHVLGNYLETGDPDKPGRIQRFTGLVDGFVKHLKIDSMNSQYIHMAAQIHGAAIHGAPRASRETVGQRHHDISLKIARRLDMQEIVASILRDHQEHFDGSGSPRGLKGSEIPHGSRILRLVEDFLDLAESDGRIDADKAEPALKEIRRQSGLKYDPNLVQSFLEFLSVEGIFGGTHFSMEES